jgi:hypothetical protein
MTAMLLAALDHVEDNEESLHDISDDLFQMPIAPCEGDRGYVQEKILNEWRRLLNLVLQQLRYLEDQGKVNVVNVDYIMGCL